jgi:arginase family enzyme
MKAGQLCTGRAETMEKKLERLKVIEVPFDETKPFWKVFFTGEGSSKEVQIESYRTRPEGWRELDDYKLGGVYYKAGVPFSVEEVECAGHTPHEEQIGHIAAMTAAALRQGEHVVMAGGGCSHAIGVAGGLRQALGADARIGLIWLDAHGDINTPETTESGLLGGTPLAVCAGLCKGKAYEEWMQAAGLVPPIQEEDIILTDGRDLDVQEEQVLRKTQVQYLDTADFNDPSRWLQAVQSLANRVDALYLHIDGDILDGKYTPDHFTIEFGGPEVETVMNNVRTVMETGKVIAYSLVSIYFDNDKPGKEVSTLNGMRILGAGLEAWQKVPVLNIV